jgi:hypothetical protein
VGLPFATLPSSPVGASPPPLPHVHHACDWTWRPQRHELGRSKPPVQESRATSTRSLDPDGKARGSPSSSARMRAPPTSLTQTSTPTVGSLCGPSTSFCSRRMTPKTVSAVAPERKPPAVTSTKRSKLR